MSPRNGGPGWEDQREKIKDQILEVAVSGSATVTGSRKEDEEASGDD